MQLFTSHKKSDNNEALIYVVIWLMVLALPIFTLRGTEYFNWSIALQEWIRFVPFLLIFIINNKVLVPNFLFKKRNVQYIVWLSIAIIGIVYFSEYLRFLNESFHPNPPPRFSPDGFHPRANDGKILGGRLIDKIIISFLVVGFNTAIKFVFKRQEEEQQAEIQKKMHLETELALLRHQISPHFFMNTLNNIHALIDIEKTQAQKAVIKLSHLMRYLLSESKKGTATLKEEFEFLNSYIDLMRLRFSEKVKVTVSLTIEDDAKKIPSLLFVSLVENAFKYGVSYSKLSSISIMAHEADKELVFTVENTKSSTNTAEESTGVGLENLRKQLELIYGSRSSFNISEDELMFKVELKIPFIYD